MPPEDSRHHLLVCHPAGTPYHRRPALGMAPGSERKRIQTEYYQLLKKKRKMRKKIVAGNWKMNINLQDGVALAKEINEALAADKPNCDVVICTPFIHLASVAQVLDSEIVGLGAENCADKAKGAFTGEVSAEMVKSTGAQYVILGSLRASSVLWRDCRDLEGEGRVGFG